MCILANMPLLKHNKNCSLHYHGYLLTPPAQGSRGRGEHELLPDQHHKDGSVLGTPVLSIQGSSLLNALATFAQDTAVHMHALHVCTLQCVDYTFRAAIGRAFATATHLYWVSSKGKADATSVGMMMVALSGAC